jgi:hypothetical protein
MAVVGGGLLLFAVCLLSLTNGRVGAAGFNRHVGMNEMISVQRTETTIEKKEKK